MHMRRSQSRAASKALGGVEVFFGSSGSGLRRDARPNSRGLAGPGAHENQFHHIKLRSAQLRPKIGAQSSKPEGETPQTESFVKATCQDTNQGKIWTPNASKAALPEQEAEVLLQTVPHSPSFAEALRVLVVVAVAVAVTVVAVVVVAVAVGMVVGILRNGTCSRRRRNCSRNSSSSWSTKSSRRGVVV